MNKTTALFHFNPSKIQELRFYWKENISSHCSPQIDLSSVTLKI